MGDRRVVAHGSSEEEAVPRRRRTVVVRIARGEGQALTRISPRPRQEEEEIAVPRDLIGSYFF
jgi:hypothetical protein